MEKHNINFTKLVESLRWNGKEYKGSIMDEEDKALYCTAADVLEDLLQSVAEWTAKYEAERDKSKDAVQVVRCIQTALPFEYGKVYPICGWNNGVHIIGVSEQGDPVDLVCHNYGDELWDAEKTDGIECLGARFVFCTDGERKDGADDGRTC